MLSTQVYLCPSDRLELNKKMEEPEKNNDPVEMTTPKRVGAPDGPPKTFNRIELTKIDKNLFLGKKQNLWLPNPGAQRIYGGQVIGQALAAAIKSTPNDKILHSMHCYFLNGGKNTSDIVYSVKVLRNGRSFCTRVVTAQQFGDPIFVLIASFHVKEFSSLKIQPRIPFVPPPHHCLTVSEWYTLLWTHDSRAKGNIKLYLQGYLEVMKAKPVEIKFIRHRDPLGKFGKFKQSDYKNLSSKILSKMPMLNKRKSSTQKTVVWIKAKENMVNADEDSQRALFGYISDWFLVIFNFKLMIFSLVQQLEEVMDC